LERKIDQNLAVRKYSSVAKRKNMPGWAGGDARRRKKLNAQASEGKGGTEN